MFKKEFSPGAKSKVKSSTQRALRTKLLEAFPNLEPHIDDILPKKSQLDVTKIPDRVSLYCLGTVPLFYQHMDDPLVPHLKLVHRYPWCFPRARIDKGGVRFVLGGAQLMAPGLTSKGGRLPGDAEAGEEYGNGGKGFEKGEVVVVDAEGKENACMVGVLSMGSAEMKEKGKGIAIENGHFVGDGLWKLDLR